MRHKLIGVIVVAVLLTLINVLMLVVLRPQDKYISTIGTVIESNYNATIYAEDRGIAVYYVDHVKYEHRFGSFMFNARSKHDKYLIRYKEGQPENVRSHLYPLFMMLILFCEIILIVILYYLVYSIIAARKKAKRWTKRDRQSVEQLNRRHDTFVKIQVYIFGFIFVASVLSIFLSQPIYNSTNNYSGSVNNYSVQDAQQLECENDSFTTYITKENKIVYYSVKPLTSEKYFISIAPSIDVHCEVFDENNETLLNDIFQGGQSMTLNLISGNIHYIKLSYDYQLSYRLPIILIIQGEK